MSCLLVTDGLLPLTVMVTAILLSMVFASFVLRWSFSLYVPFTSDCPSFDNFTVCAFPASTSPSAGSVVRTELQLGFLLTA